MSAKTGYTIDGYEAIVVDINIDKPRE